jgi:hypothetical protein
MFENFVESVLKRLPRCAFFAVCRGFPLRANVFQDGDVAEIRTKRVRKQKTDRQDAQLILQLLLEDRFRQIWVPSTNAICCMLG